MALNKEFTIDIVKAGNLINTFPSFLKSCVSSLYDIVKSKPVVSIIVHFTNVASGIERAMRHLGPLIHERLEQEARHGAGDLTDEPVSCCLSVTVTHSRYLCTE